jgi:hypothetical protein
MRGTPLREFQDANELGRLAVLTAQIFPKPIEYQPDVFHLVPLAFDLRLIEGESQEVSEIEILSLLSNAEFCELSFAGTTIAARPGTAIHATKNRTAGFRVFAPDAPPPAVLSAPYRARVVIGSCRAVVSIIRYRVK